MAYSANQSESKQSNFPSQTVCFPLTTSGTSSYTEIYSGSAIITEFSVEAGQDDVTTFSATLQGSGAFTYPSGD